MSWKSKDGYFAEHNSYPIKPGIRKYVGVKEIPSILNNLGIAILSTPKGIITDREASKLGVGGEVLCYVW